MLDTAVLDAWYALPAHLGYEFCRYIWSSHLARCFGLSLDHSDMAVSCAIPPPAHLYLAPSYTKKTKITPLRTPNHSSRISKILCTAIALVHVLFFSFDQCGRGDLMIGYNLSRGLGAMTILIYHVVFECLSICSSHPSLRKLLVATQTPPSLSSRWEYSIFIDCIRCTTHTLHTHKYKKTPNKLNKNIACVLVLSTYWIFICFTIEECKKI